MQAKQSFIASDRAGAILDGKHSSHVQTIETYFLSLQRRTWINTPRMST